MFIKKINGDPAQPAQKAEKHEIQYFRKNNFNRCCGRYSVKFNHIKPKHNNDGQTA